MSESTLRETLGRIVKAEGRYSRDELTFANNTIEDMQECAVEALTQLTEMERDHEAMEKLRETLKKGCGWDFKTGVLRRVHSSQMIRICTDPADAILGTQANTDEG